MKTIKKFKSSNAGKVTVATVLAVTVFTMLVGVYLFVRPAEAVVPSNRSDRLSDSRPSTKSNHTIAFTLNASEAWNASETVTLDFDTDFNLSALSTADPLDYDIVVGATEETIVAAGNCATTDAIEVSSILNNVITFTACPSYTAEAAGSTVTIEIGTNATFGGAGNSQITNPPKTGNTECPTNNATAGQATICRVQVSGTAMSSSVGVILVAIVEGVSVTASIAESLSFTITGRTEAECETTPPTWSDEFGVATTATTVPFGTITTFNAFYHGCQNLQVSTNAATGYTVRGHETTSLLGSTTSATIDDSTCDDNACTESAADNWETEANNPGFAISCKNDTGTPCHSSFINTGDSCLITTGPCYKQLACMGTDAECDPGTGGETPQVVLTGTSPVNGAIAEIEYRLSVDAIQEADSYTTTVVWVATGNF